MNTTAQALVFAVSTVAVAALVCMGMTAPAVAQPAAKIERLETVVIIGHRSAAAVSLVEELPRVVVIGHRQVQSDTQVAAAAGQHGDI